MSRQRSPLAFLLLGVLLLLEAGCAADPSTGWSAVSTFPDSVSTIAIPIARNDTFARGVEFELTEAIIHHLEANTPYKVTTTTRADSILAVQIREVALDQLSKSKLTGLGEEVLIGVTIDFEWRVLDTGHVLVKRQAFTGQGLFLPSQPTSERIDLGRRAVVQSLAKDVVNEMRSSW